jgi:hypothetical protein
MGDIADAIINGDMDQFTGEWIGNGQGYPRSISERKRGARFRRTDFSESDKLNGVMVYLHDKGVTNAEQAHTLIKEYGKHIGHVPTAKKNVLKIALKIQEAFPNFVEWLKTKNFVNH